MLLDWMIRSAALALLLAMTGWLFERAQHGTGRPARGVWLAVLVLSVAVPLLARLAPELWPVVLRRTVYVAAVVVDEVIPSAAVVMAEPTSRFGFEWLVGACWLALSLFYVMRYAYGWAALSRARRRWRAGHCCGADVLISDDVGPALVGLVRPRVVTPQWLLDAGAERQRMVMLHELEHERARDHWVLALAPLLVALMPWSPALWWQQRRLRLAIELDCDRRVLSRGVEPLAYGAMLLDVAASARVWAAAALAAPRSLLARRIAALGGATLAQPIGARALLATAGCATLLLAATVSAPAAVRMSAAAASQLSPLYVLDGVVLDGAAHVAATNLSGSAVEQIEILKDGAAVEAYGARGRNGVVRVTTERRADTQLRERQLQQMTAAERALTAPRVIDTAARTTMPLAARLVERSRPATLVVRDTRAAPRQPLIVIDGVVLAGGTVAQLQLQSLDIESIEVLKGAAATALYGTRASDGIIFITTRRGRDSD